MPPYDESDEGLVRFSTALTQKAYALLKRESIRRKSHEARFVPLGYILSQLISQHLEPDSERAGVRRRKRAA